VLNPHHVEVKLKNVERSMDVKKHAEEEEDHIAVNLVIDTHK
jgi:hypothetical protein